MLYAVYWKSLLIIHVGCGLVNDDDFVVPEKCPGHTQQLALPDTEVASGLTHIGQQPTRQAFHFLHKLNLDI